MALPEGLARELGELVKKYPQKRADYFAMARKLNYSNRSPSRLIAQVTGGRLLSPTEDPFSGPRPRAYREIWALLAGAALVFFLVDVAVRRGLMFRRRAGAVEPRVASEAAA